MGSSTRVLHVDDEPGFSDLLETVLEKETHNSTVIAVSSAEEALEKLETGEFDCIVSDYDMPEKNGLELLTAVREHHPELPFILFTGKGSESIASEAITAGVTDYFQKGAGKEHYELLVNRITHAVNQYRAEQEIRDTKEYFSTILSHTSDYIMIVDETGRVSYVSSPIDRLMGYSPEEIIGMNAFKFVHPDDMEPAAGTFSRVLSNPSGEFVEEFRAQHNDGSWVWLEVRGKNLIEDPVVGGILVDARDITTRKEYEDNLAILTESLPELFLSDSQTEIIDRGSDIAVRLVPDTCFDVYLVESDERLVPVPSPTNIDDADSPASIPLDRADLLKEAIESSDTKRVDLRETGDEYLVSNLSADHHIVIPLDHRGILLLTQERSSGISEEQLSLLELLASNITAALKYLDWKDRVESREELVTTQNNRLEEFTSIVSHDLRNPLNIAQGRLELAQSEVTSEHLAVAAEAHSRMLNLIEDLLALAKHGEAVIDPEAVDLKQIAQTTWDAIGDADIKLTVEDSVRAIEADPTQLRQLLANLFQNSVQHGENVRTLTIGQLPDGFFVEDDGHGISAEEQKAVFQAGYSTAPEGTGFGLRIVESVVEAHNWEISLTTGSDGGARFEITTT